MKSEYLYPLFYDGVYNCLRDKDIQFYVNRMKNANSVCEIGAGTGRITIPALQAGAKVHAVEPSVIMLDCLKNKANKIEKAKRNSLTIENVTMANFKQNGFDLIVCPFRPFQHINTMAEQFASLQNVWSKLRPNGQLILDVFAPNYFKLAHPMQDEIEASFRHPETNNLFERIANVQPNYLEQVLYIHFIYCELNKKGEPVQTWDEYLTMRWFHRFEMEHLLWRVGFEIVEIFGDFYKETPYDYYSGEMIFITRKMGK